MKTRYAKVLMIISVCLIFSFLISYIIVLSMQNSELIEVINEKEDIIVDYQGRLILSDEKTKDLSQQTNEINKRVVDNESSKSSRWYDSYQLKFAASQSGDTDLLIKNPIDKNLDLAFEELKESGSYTVISGSEIYSKYCSIWKSEMDTTYRDVLEIIEDKYKKEIELSHDNWNDYYSSYYNFLQVMSSDMYDTGGYGAWIFLEANKSCFEEVRDRTLFLKEIISVISGEVKFYNN